MPAEQAGVAAAVASTSRQVGQTLGVAIAGAIAAGGLATTAGPAFAESSHPAWWLISGCGALAVAVGAGTTTGWARGTARRTAAALTPSVESSG